MGLTEGSGLPGRVWGLADFLGDEAKGTTLTGCIFIFISSGRKIFLPSGARELEGRVGERRGLHAGMRGTDGLAEP